MRTSTARALHLALFGLGALLYIVFVLPRWWVLTGDIPRTLATAGRIAAGIPIALAAWPVMQLLQTGLRTTPRPPELALRLRAWSAVLHVVAGVLILLAAIAEIWLRLQVGGPWLFGVYGAAAAIAVLGLLALYLSFVAAQPPGAPKPPKAKAKKAPKSKKAQGEDKKPTSKRGRKKPVPSTATEASVEVAETSVVETVVVEIDGDATEEAVTAAPETEATETEATGTEATKTEATPSADTPEEQPAALRNKRPAGKSRRRLSR